MEGKSLKEQKEFLEELEEKKLYYRLKRWEKKIFKYLKNLFYKDENIKGHIKNMEEQEKQFENEVKEENNNYEILREKIEIEKIEEKKNEIIKEKEQKYNNIIAKLESIKNDRAKIIEFFEKPELILNYFSN